MSTVRVRPETTIRSKGPDEEVVAVDVTVDVLVEQNAGGAEKVGTRSREQRESSQDQAYIDSDHN